MPYSVNLFYTLSLHLRSENDPPAQQAGQSHKNSILQ